jgi:para-nitrobenzyl esterase
MHRSLLIGFAAIGMSATGVACKDADVDTSFALDNERSNEELAQPSDALEIVTHEGIVQGMRSGTTRVFLGIPYVAPPVGALRWAHPRPHEPWSTPLAATTIGPRCPQTDITGQSGGDEDCLTLNVWAPDTLPSPAPVMVYIHGGNFTANSGGNPGTNGQLLSEVTGALIVTINYRLGPFGFLAASALAEEDPTQPSSGNYGFEDQRAALDWVQANIVAFGGDPSNVTLFGESAGAASACLHLLSPRAKGLFQRAILESGFCENTPVPMVARQTQSASLVESTGCAGEPSSAVACLRSKSAEEVLNAAPADAAWGPVIDGWNLPDCAATPISAGCIANQVPVVLGTNRNEAEFLFATGLPAPVDENAYVAMMNNMFDGQGPAIVARYPPASFPSAAKAAAEALTDARFVCPTRRTGRELDGAGLPVFLYAFNHAPVSPVFPDAGAFHTSEIPFVFGTSLWGIQLDEPERALSRMMMGYWGRMAATGNPNGAGALPWPEFDSTDANIVFDLSLSTTTGWKDEPCSFWDALL